ncbi:MAG: DUF2769 domain-containing protein [Methanomicrobiales archaeon]|nr:DUF2769 domain-containing protein [Methanomicrobiales archaeon]
MALLGKKEEKPVEDQYLKMQRQMMAMPREQVMAKVGELLKMCVCPKCPTYNDCSRNAMEGLFCSMGHSFHCITANKGCICMGCPVAKMQGLKYSSFCLMGDEKTQRFDHWLKK